jgi:hypothetical protein
MPPNAVFPYVDRFMGKGTNLDLWRNLFQLGVENGEAIGLAKGIVGATLVFLLLGFFIMAVALILHLLRAPHASHPTIGPLPLAPPGPVYPQLGNWPSAGQAGRSRDRGG